MTVRVDLADLVRVREYVAKATGPERTWITPIERQRAFASAERLAETLGSYAPVEHVDDMAILVRAVDRMGVTDA